MTDIVERLRDPSRGSPRWGDTMAEAADEIERLRAERDRLREERAELRKLLVGLGAGIPAAAILRAEDRTQGDRP